MDRTTDTAVKVFCSYAPEDEKWLRKLEAHLSLLKQQGFISLSHKRLIPPGYNVTQAIDNQLEAAFVILLLISANFFASSDCYEIEMNRALERQKEGKARVIPILVCSGHWANAPFARLQVLPKNARPIADWSNEDAAFEDVVAGICQAIGVPSLLATSAPHTAASPIGMIPYLRNRFFLKREDLLAQLHERLRPGERRTFSHPQAISGPPGIGKTQLAVEYAYCYAQYYEKVLWARAENIEALNSSFTLIAQSLELPEINAQEQEVINEAVWRWLRTHSGWLLIMDNADELHLVADYLSLPLMGHLLITTKAPATGKLAERLEVDELVPEQGATLLLRRARLPATDASLDLSRHPYWERAMQISHEFQGLPLALDQAGAYLEETGMGLDRYWQLYQQHRRELLHRRGDLEIDHPESVVTTFLLSFQKVREKQPIAARLLQLCAFLVPDAIPETIPEKLVGQDTFAFVQAVKALRAYSLIRYDPWGHTLSIHRLVQAVLYDELSDEEREELMQRAVTLVNDTFPDSDEIARELWLPHALLVSEKWIKQEKMVSPVAAKVLRKTGYSLCEHARYTEAEPLYRDCLRIREQSLGNDPDVAQSLSDLANLSSELGRYVDAEELLTRSLKIREQSLGHDHPDVACLLNNQAILRKVRGRYPEAEDLLTRSLRNLEQRLGEDHLDVARLLNNLAVLYAELGRYEEAGVLFTRSLRNLERSREPAHLGVAQSLSNQAHLSTEQGRYAEAMDFYKRSVNIFGKYGRSEHSDAAYPHNGLGILYTKQGNYKDAKKSFKRSKKIWEQILEPEHPQVAYSFHNLAVLYTKQARYAEAQEREKHYEKAKDWFDSSLRIWEEKLGSEHRHTQTCARNYAILLHILKRDAEAPELARKYKFSNELVDKLAVLSTFRSFRL